MPAKTHLISPRDLKPTWLGLYAATLILQLPFAELRAAVAQPPLSLALKLAHTTTAPTGTLAVILGYGPLALSLATLILPLGHWYWRQREGARIPTHREQQIYQDALTRLHARQSRLRLPKRWYVQDSEDENAATYANGLIVTRGLLDSGNLSCLLGQELAHLNSSDTRLTTALSRLTPPPHHSENRLLNILAQLWSGTPGLWPLRAAWQRYWRTREHQANHFATHLAHRP